MQGGFGKITAHGDIHCALPPAPAGPADAAQWYHAAMQLPETRVTGWFGCVIGNGARGGDVQLFFHDGDHLDPNMRMVIDRRDLLTVYAAIGRLLMERFNS